MEKTLISAIKNGDFDEAERILNNGDRPSELTHALSYSACRPMNEFVEQLLAHGADPNRIPNILCNAIKNDQNETVNTLLDAGADPNKYDYLLTAAYAGNLDATNSLLAAGADPRKQTDSAGLLYRAVRSKNTDVLNRLLTAGAIVDDPEFLVDTAISSDDQKMLAALIAAGIKPELPSGTKNVLRREGHTATLNIFLAAIADTNKTTSATEVTLDSNTAKNDTVIDMNTPYATNLSKQA